MLRDNLDNDVSVLVNVNVGEFVNVNLGEFVNVYVGVFVNTVMFRGMFRCYIYSISELPALTLRPTRMSCRTCVS